LCRCRRGPHRAAAWTPLVAATFILLVAAVVGSAIVRMNGGVPATGLNVVLSTEAIFVHHARQ